MLGTVTSAGDPHLVPCCFALNESPDVVYSVIDGKPKSTTALKRLANIEANRTAWNEGATAYTDDVAQTIEFLRAGGSNLHPVERDNLGILRGWCRAAIHLQCASGRDTLVQDATCCHVCT